MLNINIVENTQKLVIMDILNPELLENRRKMKERPNLGDYCIKTKMIENYWGSDEVNYRNKKGERWKSTAIGDKFSAIVESIDNEIESGGVLKNIYKSGNGENNNHYIFFDATESAMYNQKLKNASLADYDNIIDAAPHRFMDYEDDTYNNMRRIIELWDAKVIGFHTAEMNEFSDRMEKLIPYTKDIKETNKILKGVKSPKAEEAFNKLEKEFEKNKCIVRECMERFYVKTRTLALYHYWINEEKKCKGEVYYRLFLEWKKKWVFVIETAISIYPEISNEKLDVADVVKVLQIWYQYKNFNDKRPEKRYDLSEEAEKKEYSDFLRDVLEAKNFNEKGMEEIRSFVIIRACHELEDIVERDESTIKSLEKEMGKAQNSKLKKKRNSILECINVINPRKYRINTLEMAENEIMAETND